MRNVPGWTADVSEPEYVGKMPVREDVEVTPEPKIEWYKREIGYWWWRLLDLIPSIRKKNTQAIEEWEKERQEFMDEELKYREKMWAEGKPTYMLPLDTYFNKPHPVPRRGSLHWNVGKMEFVMVNPKGRSVFKDASEED
jgi:hypothetical protein